MRTESLVTVNMKIMIFRGLTPCTLVDVHRSRKRTFLPSSSG